MLFQPSSHHPSASSSWNPSVLSGSGDFTADHLLIQILMDYIIGKIVKNIRYSRATDFLLF